MGTPPPAPQGDAAPSPGAPIPQSQSSPVAQSTPGPSGEKGGKGKLIGIILGGILAVAVIVLALLFFLPKEELPLQPAKEPPKPPKPDTALADYLKGKRLTYVLTEELLKAGPLAGIMGPSLTAQLAGKTVFQQFEEASNTTQFGFALPNMTPAGSPKPGSERMAVLAKGIYTVDGLNLVIKKDGGNDTVVFTNAEPVAGDEVIMKYPNGEKVKVSIVKVGPAEPLEDINTAMMGSLGLKLPEGGLEGLGALAGLAPSTGANGSGFPGLPRPGYPQAGAGGAQGKPARPGKPGGGGAQIKQGQGKTQQWTFGSGQRDLSKWKGKGTHQQVIQFFGKPDDAKPWRQGGGAWTYNNMKIKDVAGKSHASVTFYMKNGVVVDVKLPTAVGGVPVN